MAGRVRYRTLNAGSDRTEKVAILRYCDTAILRAPPLSITRITNHATGGLTSPTPVFVSRPLRGVLESIPSGGGRDGLLKRLDYFSGRLRSETICPHGAASKIEI